MPHTLSRRQIANRLNPEPKFRLDQWKVAGGGIERTIGWIDDLSVARAAFAKACEVFPDRILTLRRGAQILAEYPERAR
jgi:hypothetical protein